MMILIVIIIELLQLEIPQQVLFIQVVFKMMMFYEEKLYIDILNQIIDSKKFFGILLEY
jgi:hypothetical protein